MIALSSSKLRRHDEFNCPTINININVYDTESPTANLINPEEIFLELAAIESISLENKKLIESYIMELYQYDYEQLSECHCVVFFKDDCLFQIKNHGSSYTDFDFHIYLDDWLKSKEKESKNKQVKVINVGLSLMSFIVAAVGGFLFYKSWIKRKI